MEKRTKNWLLIGCGGAIFLVMVGVAVIGGLGFTLYQQVGASATFVKPDDAARTLDGIRATLPGPPKITLRETNGQAEVVLAKPVASPVSLTSMHVAAYDPSEKKLVQFTVPFWIVRMLPDAGKVKVNGEEVLNHLSTPSGKLTAKDIEALGPGLLVDDNRPDHTRVIIWTE